MPASSWRRSTGRFGSTTLPGSNPPSRCLSQYLQNRLQPNKNRANYCLKKPILYTKTGLGKATERFLDVCSVIRTLSQVSQLLQNL